MDVLAAATILMTCYFDRPADGSVPIDSIPVMRVPLTEEVAATFRAGRPPSSANRFAGEEPAPEWVFGQVKPGGLQLLRVRFAPERGMSSPFAARLGMASKNGNGDYEFKTRMNGFCQLPPADGNTK